MNEKYAIDPAAPDSARDLKILLDQFGLQTGRFIARYPSDWDQFVRDKFREAPPIEKQRITELFARRKTVSLPCEAPFKRVIPWGKNVLELAHKRLFARVIGQDGNEFGFESLGQVLYDEAHSLPSGQGCHIEMQAQHYSRCSSPLFAFSSRILLVDPFFWLPNARRARVLKALLREAATYGVCEEFELVVSTKTVPNQANARSSFELELERLKSHAEAADVEVTYRVLDDAGHGRYLLSVHGGIQFDHGFDEHSERSNHVHWLSKPELEPLLARFGV